MNYLKLPLLTVILFCFAQFLSAQSVGVEQKVALLSLVKEGKVYLRWMPTDYQTWETGNQNGYTIRRYRYSQNGVQLDLAEMQASEVEVATGLFPLLASSWATQFPGNEYAIVAKEALYNTDGMAGASGTPSLADAVNQEEFREGKHLFGLFAAEQDFAVAQAMGLGFLDETVSTTDEYLYYVEVQGQEAELKASALVDVRQATTMPTPPQPMAEGFDRGVLLQWPIGALEEFYGAYDIERSANGGPFQRVNEHPFFFAAEDGADVDVVAYRDSLDDNTTNYQYRILGRTPFGTTGPASPPVSVKGQEPPLGLSFSINEQEVLAPTEVKLGWQSFPDSLAAEISGFWVYCAKDPLGEYIKVNTTMLPANLREYTVANALPTAYYRVEAVDRNDHRYQTPAALVQLPDATPPAVPAGFTGRFITDDKVELTWDFGEDEDLYGYRLFTSNRRGTGYIQITEDVVVDDQFVYYVDPGFIVDSIYFTILATDQRENNSAHSTPLALARPDIVPPASPILFKVNPTPAGTAIGFRFSSSPDVARHVLERKIKEGSGWVTVLTVHPDEEAQYGEDLTPDDAAATCFIDDASLERRAYEYRFLAYDASGNVSSSAPMEVTPYDNGLRGAIENFAVTVACTPAPSLPNQAAYDLLEEILTDIEVTGSVDYDALSN
ncbi:MAG: hypothetical protein AAF840_11650, partial [Bacteroidota bacterium]